MMQLLARCHRGCLVARRRSFAEFDVAAAIDRQHGRAAVTVH
jgi:hypothetical protein